VRLRGLGRVFCLELATEALRHNRCRTPSAIFFQVASGTSLTAAYQKIFLLKFAPPTAIICVGFSRPSSASVCRRSSRNNWNYWNVWNGWNRLRDQVERFERSKAVELLKRFESTISRVTEAGRTLDGGVLPLVMSIARIGSTGTCKWR
jgi:hypothetical protein